MKDFGIAELIYNSFRGELTEEERQELDIWLSADKNNKVLFNRICDQEQILQKASFFDRFNSQKAWNRIQNRVGKRRSISTWYKYAMFFILPLVLGGLSYLSWQIYKEDPGKTIVGLQPTHLGHNGVIMKLADGRVLDLKNTLRDTLDGGIALTNTDGILHYSVESRKKTDSHIQYNEVVTPRGGEYCIVLSDGTKVWLNAESSLRFPVSFTSEYREVHIKGELFFEVAPDKNRPFLVVSDQSVVEVIGTEFNVRAYANQPYATTLVSGKVHLTCKGEQVYLKPGQQAVLYNGTENFRISEVDVAPFVAWKEGRFLFDNVPLEDIMQELGRWYNIDVFFTNDTFRKEHFSVELRRHENLEEVLKLMNQTGVLKLEVKNQVIIVK